MNALLPGPMRDLVEALHELHRASGMLSRRVISDAIRLRDDLPDTVSHETVGMMFRGTRLIGWTKFECVVRLLAERSVDPVFEPSTSVRRFHRLWLNARDAAGPTSATARLASASTAGRLHPLIRSPAPINASVPEPRSGGRPASSPRALLTNLGERNQAFVGREKIHLALDEAFLEQPRLPVVLSGPGGVGKSQLAIEYAYRSVDRYDLIWFISADDGFGAREMLAGLGSRLRILPGQNRERTVISVLRALEQTELRWMLIFDNAAPEIPLDTPITKGVGDVVITTRAPEWTSTRVRLIPVDVLTRSESIRFLRDADGQISEAEADGLAEMLGDLPLALAQLAATRRATGMPLARYRDLFQRHVQDLLATGRAPYYPASLGATVMTSLAQLDGRGATLQLVELFAHFGPDPVPWTLLRNGRRAAVTDALRRCLDDSRQLGTSLDEIARLGLIRIEADGHAMHRLVRLALRENLTAESLDRGRINTHALLAAANPREPERRSNWPGHALLTPHVLPSGLVDDIRPDCRAAVLDQIRYLHELGDYERSIAVAEAAIASWSAATGLGAEHESTLLAKRHLANAFRLLGDFTDARKLNDSVVISFEENPAYGPDHPLTLEARRSCGTDLHIAGEYRRALDVESETYERHRRVHGADHPSTLHVANNRGNSHRVLGQYAKAEQWHRLVAERRAAVLAPSHSLTYLARMNWAWDLLCLGRSPEALAELEEIRGLVDLDLRPGHRLALFIGRAYAVGLRRIGRHEEALLVIEENYAQCNDSLGGDNEATLASGITYANTLAALDRAGEASRVVSETRASLSRSFGGDNPFTLAASVNAAIIVRKQGRWTEAADVARDSWVGLTRRLGPDHPYTVCAANAVASGLFLDGLYGRARHMSEQILEHAAHRYPGGHPDRLVLVANAGLDRSSGGDEAGEPMREAAIRDLAEVLSPQHPVARSLQDGERLELDIEPPPL